MPRRLLLLSVAAALLVGCQRLQTRRDLTQTKPPAAAVSPPATALAKDLPPRPAPVPPALEPTDYQAVPPAPAAARSAPPDADDRKPLRERLQERRDERQQRRAAPPAQESPKLPSPLAPRDERRVADARTPIADAPSLPKADDLEPVKKLYRVAAERYEKMTDFEARLVRQEVVKDRQGPKEELLFQYRKQPLSVYMKSIVPSGRGREVLYVRGKFDNKMFVLIGDAEANFLMKAGTVHPFDPDNALVASRSRKRVYEAGIGDSLAKFGRVIEETASGRRPNGVKYLGMVERKEYPYQLEGIEVTIVPGDDPHLPKGGKKYAYFDMRPESPSYGVPVLTVTCEPDGREVEYNCFDRVRIPAGLTDADFHPDRLGRKK